MCIRSNFRGKLYRKRNLRAFSTLFASNRIQTLHIEASRFNIECGSNFIRRVRIDVKMDLSYAHLFVNINFFIAAN